MKAVVWHGVGDIRLDDVREPKIKEPTDAIVRLTSSAICGTDLHFIRGTMSGMVPGTILGHEGVGVVEEVGKDARNLSIGDRVVIPSTIACGTCSYCRAGYYAQCDKANPNGPLGGHGIFRRAERVRPDRRLAGGTTRAFRMPASACVKLPDEVTDDQAILIVRYLGRRHISARTSRASRPATSVCRVRLRPGGPVRHCTSAQSCSVRDACSPWTPCRRAWRWRRRRAPRRSTSARSIPWRPCSA